MAENLTNDAEQTGTTVDATSSPTPRRASRLAIIIGFIGAAFAAWLIISLNTG